MIMLGAALALGRSFLDSWSGRIITAAAVGWVALVAYGHFEQRKGAATELTRQETNDVNIAAIARARVHALHARRVLDPTTSLDTSGQ